MTMQMHSLLSNRVVANGNVLENLGSRIEIFAPQERQEEDGGREGSRDDSRRSGLWKQEG